MTVKEVFANHHKRAVEKHWWLFLLMFIAFTVPIYWLTPFLASLNQLLFMLLFFAYLFLMVFVVIWFGYGTALRRTKLTQEEEAVLENDLRQFMKNEKNPTG